ncbi:hypothetical protein [Carnobacterium sp. TMP28]|uniref:hypothetical protein n=1 Tax=Carnobacterium sp. TMP28 TaxID=3397060 RepID=UPI0039DF52C1
MEKCDAIFKKEKELAELSIKERHSKRNQFIKPKIDEFFEWLRTLNPMVKGKIGFLRQLPVVSAQKLIF